MPTGNDTKLTVLVIVLATVSVAGCLALLPVAIQGCHEYTRREECARNLRQFCEALEQYEKRMAESPAPATGDEAKLAFDTYSGYFVSNRFEPDAAESFVVIGDQAQFDKVFGVAMVMGDKSHRLPADAFQSNTILAVIKRGRAVWEFKVEGVSVNDGVVALRYATTSKKSDSTEFASPLIVSIPKVKFTAVQFIEKDKLVKKIEESGRSQ